MGGTGIAPQSLATPNWLECRSRCARLQNLLKISKATEARRGASFLFTRFSVTTSAMCPCCAHPFEVSRWFLLGCHSLTQRRYSSDHLSDCTYGVIAPNAPFSFMPRVSSIGYLCRYGDPIANGKLRCPVEGCALHLGWVAYHCNLAVIMLRVSDTSPVLRGRTFVPARVHSNNLTLVWQLPNSRARNVN